MVTHKKYGWAKQKDSEEKVWELVDAYSIDEDNLDNYIYADDMYLFISIFNKILVNVFPNYELLNKYTKGIVKVLYKLKLPIPWTLPSGAIVSQSYLNFRTLRLKPFSFIGSKVNFKQILDEKYSGYNLQKNRDAIMPNLIHSLDACTIAILYRYLKGLEITNLYTVHDCFAVTANNVETLIKELKLVYLHIYTGSEFLKDFDANIRNSIINQHGNIFSEDGNIVYINVVDKEGKDKVEKHAFPNIKPLLSDVSIKELK